MPTLRSDNVFKVLGSAADGVAQAQTGAYQLVESMEEPLADVNHPHQGQRSVTSRPRKPGQETISDFGRTGCLGSDLVTGSPTWKGTCQGLERQ